MGRKKKHFPYPHNKCILITITSKIEIIKSNRKYYFSCYKDQHSYLKQKLQNYYQKKKKNILLNHIVEQSGGIVRTKPSFSRNKFNRKHNT